MKVRIFQADWLRFPGPGSSAQGESVPKARLKSVADGKQVNIPAPIAEMMEWRRRLMRAGYWIPVQVVSWGCWQIRILLNSELRIRSNVSTSREASNIMLPRKVSSANFAIDRTENEHTWSGINVPRLAS